MIATVKMMNVCLRTRSSRNPIGTASTAATTPATGSSANASQPAGTFRCMTSRATVYCPMP